MSVEVQLERGRVVVDGRVVAAGCPVEKALAIVDRCAQLLERDGTQYSDRISLAGNLASRAGRVELHFWCNKLQSIRFRGDDQPADEHDVLRTLRDRKFLRGELGTPVFEHARGAVYEHDWGWVYAHWGAIDLVFGGHKRAVGPPRNTSSASRPCSRATKRVHCDPGSDSGGGRRGRVAQIGCRSAPVSFSELGC